MQTVLPYLSALGKLAATLTLTLIMQTVLPYLSAVGLVPVCLDGILHSRMPLVPTPARLKLLHSCSQ
jgi:hypothetical protein